ncbi:MAG: HlyD family secretion protein [Proteobacteria bacterium]|nr:HlyD family secretion protein [Pseudomonadota bacterium]
MRALTRFLTLLFWCGVVAVIGYFGHAWWQTHVRPFESTDNAYVRAHMAQISARITGHVKAVHFTDNQAVQAGALLVEIDDAPLLAERDQAAAEAASRALRRATLNAELDTQNARIAQHVASFAAASASFSRAQKDLARLAGLVEDGSVPAQQRDAAESAVAIARAELARQRALTEEATRERATLAAQIAEAEAAHKTAEAALRRSEVALTHTRILAPISGVLGNRAVQVGQLLQPGAVLAFLVPQEGLFVEANFKETQLENMRAGQPVAIEVDAYPQAALTGVVDSSAPASGAEFSILPPENATGNFTKIVRRVPVKIRLDANRALALLKPGLSCVVKVRVR